MNMTVLFKKCTYGLLLIATTLIGFISFCSSVYLSEGDGNRYGSSSVGLNAGASANIGPDWNGEILGYGTFCVSFSRGNCVYDGITYSTNGTTKTLCFFNDSYSTINFSVSCTNTHTAKAYYYTFTSVPLSGGLFECEECEECQECPTIDSEYCVSNNLCPNCEGTGSCEEGEGNRSALYINDIQHPGSALINITIPEELQRNYTGDEEEMNIDVEGYGYDQEKMQQLVNTQYYTPTPDDMSSLVGKIADFLPLLAIMILFVRTRYIIKKVFKKGF